MLNQPLWVPVRPEALPVREESPPAQSGRSRERHLSYRSKYHLAREMLLELEALLPIDSQVYMLSDLWHASAKLINLCPHKHWQVICTLKANHKIEKQRLDQYHCSLKHKPYQRVMLDAVVDRRAPTYYVCTLSGYLEKVRQKIHVILTKKRSGDSRPNYILCTDTRLLAEEALKLYQKR